jgi:antitoxin component YwqK of YwqJK toxin-antitoxin module
MIKRLDYMETYLDRDYLFKYKGIPYTGLTYMLDEAGQVISEYGCCEGRKWGFSRKWYSNGQLKEDYKYFDDGVYGWSKDWHSNGQLKEEAFISKDLGLVTKRKKWNSKGELIDYFDLENDPQSNLERYQGWMAYKSIREEAKKNNIPELPSPIRDFVMDQGVKFDKEIAKYLAQYPSERVYYEKDMLGDFIG